MVVSRGRTAMDEEDRKRWIAFIDAPWLGIGVGIVIGAFGSLLSVKWLIVAGWGLISAETFRHDFLRRGRKARLAGSTALSILIGLALFSAWEHTPLPVEPLTKKDAQELVSRFIPINQPQVAPPPGLADPDKPITKAELLKMLQQYKTAAPAGIPARPHVPAGAELLADDDLRQRASSIADKLVQAWSVMDQRVDELSNLRGITRDAEKQKRLQVQEEGLQKEFIPENEELIIEANHLRRALLERLGRNTSEMDNDPWFTGPSRVFSQQVIRLRKLANELAK